MHRVPIKPLSVNGAWQGKRYKSPEYTRYERDLGRILPAYRIPDGALEIALLFGFSNSASDWDNPIKPFVDVLQKRYEFDDKRIFRGVVEKRPVKKGQEFVAFALNPYVPGDLLL